MELVLPSVQYKRSFIEAVKEFQKNTDMRAVRRSRYHELSTTELEKNFNTFVERELSHAEGKNLPAGYVPQTDYWLIDRNEFIGHVNIRHELTDHLKEIGGHIGYDIRPSKRRQGYGNKILELTISKAKNLGIDQALLTCDVTNIPSRKIIEKNGGILENEVTNPETGVNKLRFWIKT